MKLGLIVITLSSTILYYKLENDNIIIAQPREHFLQVVSVLAEKSLPLILDKATPAEKLIIMTMIWKTFGFHENNFKNPQSS